MKLILLLAAVTLFAISEKCQALYISLENTRSAPILFIRMNCHIVPTDSYFMISSPSTDSTDLLLPIDENSPLDGGEIYNTPLIPELTDVSFGIVSCEVHSPEWSTFFHFGTNTVTPDVTTYTIGSLEHDYGVTISFYSGGEIPEPTTILLLGLGAMMIRRKRGR